MKQPMARVVSHEQIAHGIYELTLFTPIADVAEPGRLRPCENSRRRRYAASASHQHCAQRGGRTLTLIYQIKGKGTRLLSHVGAGDFLDVLGPLGNEFSTKGVRRALVVGGGMGAAPLENLLLHNRDIEFDVVLGFRSQKVSYRLWYFQHLAHDFNAS